MADSSVDGLRQEPVGEDTKGNLYYYFSFNNEDCRLYRQEPPFKKSAKRRRSGGEDAQWETVCTTVEEMADFVESLSAARYAGHLVHAWHDHNHACTYLVCTTSQPVMQPSFGIMHEGMSDAQCNFQSMKASALLCQYYAYHRFNSVLCL